MNVIPQVPAQSGTIQEQVAQLYRYLRELEEGLQISLNSINYTSFDDETQKKLKGE